MEEIVELINKLEEIKVKFKREIGRLNRILDNSTGETLHVKRKKDGMVQYYVASGGMSKYLSKKKDAKLIKALVDKRYAKLAIKNLAQNIAAIDRFLGEVTADVGVFLADKLEEKGVPTTKRTCLSRKVRSQIWLERKRQEKKRDMEENPDFTVYDAVRDREIVYEHFGRMDDAGYVARNFRKIELCVEYGMHLGEDFFITFETKEFPLTTRMVTDTLNRFSVKSRG